MASSLIVTGISYLSPAASYLFPAGRIFKLFKSGINVTKSTSPLTLGINITLTVVDCCTPPPVRIAAHCVAAGALITASVLAPNPLTVGAAIHIVTEIYENC